MRAPSCLHRRAISPDASLPLFDSKSECLSITENKTMLGSAERGKKLFSFNCIFLFRKNLFTSMGPSPFSLSSKALRSRSRSHVLSCSQGSVPTRLLTSTVNLETPLFGTAGPTCFKSYYKLPGPSPILRASEGSRNAKGGQSAINPNMPLRYTFKKKRVKFDYYLKKHT